MTDNFIKVADETTPYSTSHFSLPKHYEDSIESILVPHGLIKDRIERMARNIHTEFNSESMILLCILKGGFRFTQDLMDALNSLNRNSGKSIQLGLDFLRLKSYTNESSGEVQIIGGDDLSKLEGKNILIAEDMIDTGKSMQKLLTTLAKYNPKSVKVACLLVKRNKLSSGYRPDHIGFEIPNVWISGYAIDYNEYFRDLNHICVLNDNGKKKYSI